jgi:hypothetical protein
VNTFHRPFLHALGLAPDATERDVRRAYAQRLKRIDPARQAAEFQSLREAYEAALAWVAAVGRSAASQQPIDTATDTGMAPDGLPLDPAQATPGARRNPADTADRVVQVNPVDQVFSDFVARVNAPLDSESAAEAALRSALEDPRLVHLDAQDGLEWRVADLLLGGWQPGHEYLFEPACQRFHWRTDLRRLRRLGALGVTIQAAIVEQDFFSGQDPFVVGLQAAMIFRLREGSTPSTRLLTEDTGRLRVMLERYPNWLPIAAPQATARHWLELYDALPASMKMETYSTRTGDPEAPPGMRWLVLVYMLILLFLFYGLKMGR